MTRFKDDQEYNADFVVVAQKGAFYIHVLLDREPYCHVGPFDSFTECNAALADLVATIGDLTEIQRRVH